MFDPACFDLADEFIFGANLPVVTEEMKDDLAQHIQNAIEDWFRTVGNMP